jgi:hypothetical protein
MFTVYGWSTGWSLMGFYSHLFWFPLLFGIIQVLFLTRLLETFDLSGRKLFRRVALPFSIATVIAGSFIEITERPALFELKPALIKQTISGTNNTTFLDHLLHPQTEDRVAFENALPATSWRIPASSRSVTEFVCGFSILLQIFIWTWTAFAFCWTARLMASGDAKYKRKRKLFIPLMLWTLILSLPWFAMRRAFEGYLGKAYSDLQVPNVTLIVGVVFLLGSLFLAGATWQIAGERLNAAVGILSSLGISGLLWQRDWLQAMFPPAPTLGQFVLIATVVAFLLTVLLVKLPK